LAELAADEVIAQRQAVNDRAAAAQRDETQRHAIQLEQERHAQEVEIARLRAELSLAALEAELATARTRADHDHAIALLEIERSRLRQDISNAQTPAGLQARLINNLSDIVSRLPKPNELKSVSFNGDTSTLPGIVATVKAMINELS
jgi:flavin reductase (DIM6/NTAB) family NADH-FMN oxidoreductase RutF